jgi:pyruvate formate lyase activating enzyme
MQEPIGDPTVRDAGSAFDRPTRWVPGSFFEVRGEQLRCVLCPHRCSLKDGQTGLCRVRRRRDAGIETATFASSVFHLDAVERKPLYHYRPGTTALTIAAPGCTFRCNYCVNHRISQFGRVPGTEWSAQAIDPAGVVGLAAQRSACVALSYTEPALAAELTLELAELGRPLGVAVVWKTNGFITPEAVAALSPALDAVNLDLKAADDRTHQRLTGAPLAPVLEALRLLKASGVWVEVATPLIPTVSAGAAELAAIAELIAGIDPGIPWHLLRFTPTFRMAHYAPTLPAELAAAVLIGRQAGLRHVYVERALGAVGRATRCPSCGEVVVARGVWALEANHLRDGACPGCGTRLEGRW